MALKTIEQYLEEQHVKRVPLSKNEALWEFLRSHFDLNPSKMSRDIIINKVDNNETFYQIEHGKNGGIGFVQVDMKVGFAEYVGENVGLSYQRITPQQMSALIKQL